MTCCMHVKQRCRIADGDNEAFDPIGNQIRPTGVGGRDHGAAASHGLAQHQAGSILNTGQQQQVALCHHLGDAYLWLGAQEFHAVCRQALQAHRASSVERANPPPASRLCGCCSCGKCLQKIGHPLAQPHAPHEQSASKPLLQDSAVAIGAG